jgi:hypothetical protein
LNIPDDEFTDPRVHREKIYPESKKINPLITIGDEAIDPRVHRENIYAEPKKISPSSNHR